MIKKDAVLSDLKNEISNGRRLVFIDNKYQDVFALLMQGIENRDLKNIDVFHCGEKITEMEYEKSISIQEMEIALDMYHAYEFSKRITFVSENSRYASMLNYVKTGVLTKQEMVDALLSDLTED